MATFTTARRFYLMKRREHASLEDFGLAGAFRAKQEAQPGAALPASFPHAARLAAEGYTTVEDLDGADEDELLSSVSLTRIQARAVLAALAPLLS